MDIFWPKYEYFSGIIVYKQGSRLGPRQQEDLQLVYIHDGDAEITIDGNRHYLGPDEATLLLPGHEETFRFSSRTSTRHGWCGIWKPALELGILKKLEALPFRQDFTPRMKSLEGIMLSLTQQSSAGSRHLHGTLVEAMLVAFLDQTGILEHTNQPRHPAIERACSFMETNYREALDLDQIAAHAGLTPAHLIRLFREQLQVTPKAYLWRIRTESAARLLKSTGLSAAEVAYACGFSNPQHFSRIFCQHHGYPPKVWRLREWSA